MREPVGREVGQDVDREAGIGGLRRANKAQLLKPEIRVRVRHLKAKGTLRHAMVKGLIER
jgi:hypothetical protein